MKNKILLISILTFLVLGYAFRSYFGFTEIVTSLNTSKSIKKKKIKIFKGWWYTQSDTLFPLNKGELIFDGEKFLSFKTDYGENDFLVVYSDSCYTKIRHNKTTNRKFDTYNFNLSKVKNKIILNVRIEGTDPYDFTKILEKK